MSKRSEAENLMFAKRIKALQDYIDWLQEALEMIAKHCGDWDWPPEFIEEGRKHAAAVAESRKITA